MAEANEDRRSSARKRAQNHFQASEQRDALVRQIIDKQQAVTESKIAKLRALRMAKEAAEAEASPSRSPDEKPAPKAPRARKRRVTAA